MNRAGSPRRAPGRHGPALLILVLCLTATTGAALLGAGAALTDARVAAPGGDPSAAQAALVRQFYAAVNRAIATGETGALDPLVATDFAWCRPCPADRAATLAGLEGYLAGLHRTAPDARLAVEEVVADGRGTATARVRPVGLPTADEPVAWGPVDTLRVAGGLLADRRSGPDGVALAAPLLTARLAALPPGVTGVALARLTFPPGAAVAGLLSAGPTLLVVEAGALEVRIASGGRVLRGGADDGDGAPAGNGAALDAVLGSGDAAIIPLGVRHALSQQGPEPAVAVGATLVFADAYRDSLGRQELTPFFPPDGAIRDSPPQNLPTVQPLAGGAVAAWPAGPVRVALGRAVLGPGGRLVPAAGEAVALAVEAGALEVAGGEDQADRTVALGGGVVAPAGAIEEARNPGGGLAVLLVLTVAPAEELGVAPSPVPAAQAAPPAGPRVPSRGAARRGRVLRSGRDRLALAAYEACARVDSARVGGGRRLPQPRLALAGGGVAAVGAERRRCGARSAGLPRIPAAPVSRPTAECGGPADATPRGGA
jgi:SnoaL-like domain